MGVNDYYFSYYNRKLLYGSRLIQAPDEVILSQNFVRKAYGDKNPIGTIIFTESSLHRIVPCRVSEW
jgi:hypothetical protein